MPWSEVSIMQTRAEFLALAQQEGANIRALCRRYGISPPTADKWLARARAGEILADQSRRPHTSPRQTAASAATQVVALRQQHPTWGGRKLRAALLAKAATDVPSASTITTLVRRAGLLAPPQPRDRPAWQRFEQPAPNVLWQMDFKGHHALAHGRSHPLTALDDHSRFNLVLAACAEEQGATVQAQLEATFRRYGLPLAILCDNGPPWGTAGAPTPYSTLGVWLLRLGIAVWHGRP
jgi:transposase InsO family protein